MLQNRFGQVLRGRGHPGLAHHDTVGFGRRLCLDALSPRVLKDQEASVGTGVLESDRHERLDELVEHDLA
jgi:hypothetical protein